MQSWLLPFGGLILTFWVSRLMLLALQRAPLGWQLRLAVAHGASLAFISLLIFWAEANNIRAPFSYVPLQLVWFGVDWLRNLAPDTGIRTSGSKESGRTRRRRRRAAGNSPYYLLLPAPLLAGAMAVVTLGYVGFGYTRFWYETISYKDIVLWGAPQDVIYSAGRPEFVRDSDAEPWRKADEPKGHAQWLYTAPLMVVRFNETGNAIEVTCTQDDKLSKAGCPTALGLSIGSGEGDVYEKLGTPPQISTTPEGRRVVRYPEIGKEYVLEQFVVRRQTTRPIGGSLAYWWRFFVWLTP